MIDLAKRQTVKRVGAIGVETIASATSAVHALESMSSDGLPDGHLDRTRAADAELDGRWLHTRVSAVTTVSNAPFA